ncbi:UPF0540 protein At1g62060-like [Brassica napus]|uniref:UPF0540 protein At1g62060-like n=1 Tax=Brassica napus TaxID=3708 RepID=UPI0006AAAEB9|nr:UPF0540 protein At1g62060-like [Brassica napus]
MNAMKFVVLLIFVGVVCANVGVRQLEEVSKETKLGISIPKTVTTNSIGAELGRVYGVTGAYNYENSNAGAAAGPNGPSADTSSTVYKSTYGYIDAEGPSASADTYSTAFGSTGANAAAGPNGAGSNGDASGYAYSGASGTTTNP